MSELEMVYGGDRLPHDPTQEQIYAMAARIRAERVCGHRDPPDQDHRETIEHTQAGHKRLAASGRDALRRLGIFARRTRTGGNATTNIKEMT